MSVQDANSKDFVNNLRKEMVLNYLKRKQDENKNIDIDKIMEIFFNDKINFNNYDINDIVAKDFDKLFDLFENKLNIEQEINKLNKLNKRPDEIDVNELTNNLMLKDWTKNEYYAFVDCRDYNI